MIDSDILNDILTTVVTCPEEDCNGQIIFRNNFRKKQGLSCCLVLSCTICDWTRDFFTSKNIEKPNHSYKCPFDVNVRAVVAFREILWTAAAAIINFGNDLLFDFALYMNF